VQKLYLDDLRGAAPAAEPPAATRAGEPVSAEARERAQGQGSGARGGQQPTGYNALLPKSRTSKVGAAGATAIGSCSCDSCFILF
jgi:hypothetical protein